MTGLGRFPENDPKMAKFGFSANNFGTEGPRDLKFGLLASPGVGLPRTGIKKIGSLYFMTLLSLLKIVQ